MDPAAHMSVRQAVADGFIRFGLPLSRDIDWHYVKVRDGVYRPWVTLDHTMYLIYANPIVNKYCLVAPKGVGLLPLPGAEFDTFAEAYQYMKMLEATGGVRCTQS